MTVLRRWRRAVQCTVQCPRRADLAVEAVARHRRRPGTGARGSGGHRRRTCTARPTCTTAVDASLEAQRVEGHRQTHPVCHLRLEAPACPEWTRCPRASCLTWPFCRYSKSFWPKGERTTRRCRRRHISTIATNTTLTHSSIHRTTTTERRSRRVPTSRSSATSSSTSNWHAFRLCQCHRRQKVFEDYDDVGESIILCSLIDIYYIYNMKAKYTTQSSLFFKNNKTRELEIWISSFSSALNEQ